MRRRMVALLAGSAIACGNEPTATDLGDAVPDGPTATAAAPSAGRWIKRASYPLDVFDLTSASVTNPNTGKSTVYVIGGYRKCCGAGQITDAVKAYDAATNTWKSRAPYPVPIRSTNGAAEVDGKIYVTGGFTKWQPQPGGPWRLQTTKYLYVYTPSRNAWERKRDIPDFSVNGASVGYRGKLYVATGNVVWRYDPATDQWSRFADRPNRDWWDVAAGVIRGKLYLVEEYGGAMDILDLATGVWTSGPARPYRACGVASTDFRAKLYLFGWCDDYPTDSEIRDRALVFDPATSAWSDVALQPASVTADAGLARVFVNEQPRLSLVSGLRTGNHFHFIP